jgi:RNA polymerase sigma factor (sigma-70 family)
MGESIELLYRLYSKDLYNFILSICKDKNLSDDILQTTFVEAIKSIEGYKGQSSVKTWLFSIAKHQCYQHLKKNKIYVNIDDYNPISEDSVIDTTITNIRSQNIMKHINDLDEPNRSILILRIIGEYSFLEIGKLIGKSENYCRVTFYRLKNKIRKEFEEHE